MNRISKLIHRVVFNTRQRRTISYFKKYVIAPNEVKRVKALKKKNKEVKQKQKTIYDIFAEERKITRHFDPLEDKWDRRLLYEVTGLRLDEDEFLESDTSDEETQA